MLDPGTQIGRYEIQRRLGRGGMGAVYVAHDPVLGRMVAIKVFAGDLDIPDARDRFAREARAAAALNHPNIVTVYDFGEYSSQPYIVMEYVTGETLAAMIRRKAPVSNADKLRWMEEVCMGVGYAHRMSVIHRDIKPANLMIDRSGRLKILDFGIARMMGTASNTMAMIGTPGYMSPEQIQGDPVDQRSDLFSIGVVLYEFLSHAEAFPGDTMPTIVHRVLSDAPVSLARLVPDLGPDIVEIVDRLLQKKAVDRFPDAESLRGALARVRQSFEAGPGYSAAPTTIARRDHPPAAGVGSRGTGSGSARRGVSDAVGVAELTPPPDPRRTDREARARRRAEQLNAALAQARTRLGAGDLEGALDACELALTFDETHPEAIALEEVITAAFAARGTPGATRSGPPASAVRDAAGDPQVSADELARVAPAAPFERPMVTPVPPPAVTDVDAAIADAQHAATVLAPRRTPPPTGPARVEPPEARALQPPEVVPVVPVAKSHPVPAAQPQPRRAKSPRPAAVGKQAAADLLAKVRGAVATIRAAMAARPAQARLYLAGAAGMALIAAAAIVIAFRPPAIVPTGTVVVDAVPWGTVQSIESDAGEPHPVPSPAATPLSWSLPAGSYQIVVAGPSPEVPPQRITVQVTEGASTVVPLVRFRTRTPEEYFEQYLAVTASDAAAPGDAPAEPDIPADAAAGAPAAPASPTGVSP